MILQIELFLCYNFVKSYKQRGGKMEIVKIKLKELKPYKYNAKEHPQEQIEQIKNSILEFGNNDPIAVWGDNNIIVEGHGRYIALQQLGYEEAECIRLDHLSEEERRAYTLAHNKLTMNTGWDFNVLALELEKLSDIDMNDFGFEDESIMGDAFDDNFSLEDGDKPEICTMTFTLHERQKELIDYAMDIVRDDISETFGNTNNNGNALYEVVRQWAEQRK